MFTYVCEQVSCFFLNPGALACSIFVANGLFILNKGPCMIQKYVGTPCKVLTFTIFHKNNKIFLFRLRRPKFGSRDLGPDYGLTNVS